MRKSRFSESQTVGILEEPDARTPLVDVLRKCCLPKTIFFR